ncbi:MAG TPA: hypothetical protein VH540_26800 [Ktedonobacterales bacterium]
MDPEPFDRPMEVAALMAGYKQPWFFAGGWAIDLFHGKVRRPHKDVDIAILRKDQLTFQAHFSDWQLKKLVGPDGQEHPEPWQPGEWLELPVMQVWMQTGSDGWQELEVLLNEADEEEWRWRVDQQIRCPLAWMGMRSPQGLPFLNPAIVLLFKSRHMNPEHFDYAHDQEDFRDTAPLLDEQQRAWLKNALTLYHSEHLWLERL